MRNNKGFTLIEILVIVAIIIILVSVIMVSLINAKNKAQDNSAFTSFKSVAAPAFVCLTSGVPDVYLNYPNFTGDNICSNPNVTSDST